LSCLIKLNNVTKTYRTDTHEFQVLKGIEFSLDRGEMVSIIGTSGSGKSTLMNIIGFLDHCSSGHYYFRDQDVSRLKGDELSFIRNQKIGFVFQSFFLLPKLNALQNVMLPLFYRGEDKEISQQKARNILRKVGMEKFATHKPNQLSGGQQQRVAIARALVSDPEIILADEPTGSLDSKTADEVMNLFVHLNQHEKRTLVIVTHDQQISQRCSRIVSIKDGYIL
jgi:putative ABC transport system ATP-binding protein